MQYDATNISNALAYVHTVRSKTSTEARDAQGAKLLGFTKELMQSKYDGYSKITTARDTLLVTCEQLQEGALEPSPAPEPACLSSASVAASVAADRESGDGDNGDAHNPWSFSGGDTGVRFSDITGAQEALQTIRESLIVPVKFPSIFRQVRAKAWKAVLLYGPPGTGKSMIARATASESSANFYNACCAELTSKWVGGSEKLMKSLFAHARAHRPAIIFFDEIDSIAGIRDSQKSIADQRLTNQMLIELDACVHADVSDEPVFVMAATNLPWQLDVAVLRRFPKRIYVALPGDEARGALFCNACVDTITFSPTELAQVVASTSGFSGADICNIVNDVGLEPLRMLTGASTFVVTEVAGAVESVCAASGLGAAAVQARVLPPAIAPAPPAAAGGVGDAPSDEPEDPGEMHVTGTRSYLLHETSLEAVIEQFTEHAVRVAPVTFAMVLECIARCKASVNRANVCKYEEYNDAQSRER